MMVTGMLGRAPKKTDKRTIQFRDIFNLSVIPSRPAARDWSQREGVGLIYPMLGNVRYGNCVYASAVHQGITQSAQTGEAIVVTEQQVVDRYLGDNGGRDEGAYMLDAIKSLIRNPLGPLQFTTFVEVDPKDDDAYETAQEHFGGIWTGWDLPLAWKGADEWTTGPGVTGQWAPRSWGGHAVTSPTYSPGGNVLITWEQRKPYTHAARRQYCVEAYALLSRPMWMGLLEHCPAGLDLQKLMDLLALVRK